MTDLTVENRRPFIKRATWPISEELKLSLGNPNDGQSKFRRQAGIDDQEQPACELVNLI
jgi:hypothetical protein